MDYSIVLTVVVVVAVAAVLMVVMAMFLFQCYYYHYHHYCYCYYWYYYLVLPVTECLEVSAVAAVVVVVTVVTVLVGAVSWALKALPTLGVEVEAVAGVPYGVQAASHSLLSRGPPWRHSVRAAGSPLSSGEAGFSSQAGAGLWALGRAGAAGKVGTVCADAGGGRDSLGITV